MTSAIAIDREILRVLAVASGHRLAQIQAPEVAIAETAEDEYTG